MPKKFHVGNAVLAEYVAKGDRNKHNLVNVYSGDVIVQKFPVDLGFGLYVELLRPSPDDLPNEFTIELKFDGKAIVAGRGSAESNVDSTSSVFLIPLFHFTAQDAGQLELFISAAGFQKRTLISKRIYSGDVTKR